MVPRSGLVDDLVTAVAASRNRPCTLLAVDLGPDEPSGLWIATERGDWVVYSEQAGPAQRSAVICHELSHILLDHAPLGDRSDLDALASTVAPDLDPAVARRLLARHGYADDLEAEAEELGTLLTTQLDRRAERQQVGMDTISDRLR